MALALPLLAPSLVQGLGLIFIFGRNGLISQWFGISINPYGFYGLLMANVLYALPQVVLIIQAALRQSDARLYEAAEVMGANGWEKFRDITLPNAKFGLVSAGFVALPSLSPTLATRRLLEVISEYWLLKFITKSQGR